MRGLFKGSDYPFSLQISFKYLQYKDFSFSSQ